MHQEACLIKETMRKLKEFFPGFRIEHTKNDQKQNSYIVQHKDKKIAYALSVKLAEHGANISSMAGKPKFVADHLQNGYYGIVLTDKNHGQIVAHQAFTRTTDGSYFFMISSKDIESSLKKNTDSPPSTGMSNTQGNTMMLTPQIPIVRSAAVVPVQQSAIPQRP